MFYVLFHVRVKNLDLRKMRKETVPKKYSPKMVVKNGDLPWYKVESNLEQTKAVKLITLAVTNIGSMMIYGNVISTHYIFQTDPFLAP